MGCRYGAAQKEQWCLRTKSVSTCGCGGTSDIMWVWSNDGQGTAVVDGFPLVAKFAQAARMLAASACWSELSPWNGAVGRSKRYESSDVCVATGGLIAPSAYGLTAALSLNS